MTMVLGPTKNAGVKRDAEQKTSSGAKKKFKVTGTGSSAQDGGSESQPGAQAREAEAGVQ